MKKAIVFLVSLLPISLNAYEIKDNPDRKLSIGFTFDRYDSSATRVILGRREDYAQLTQNSYIFDVRIPISGFFTLSGHGGQIQERHIKRFNENFEYNGWNAGASLRIYFK